MEPKFPAFGIRNHGTGVTEVSCLRYSQCFTGITEVKNFGSIFRLLKTFCCPAFGISNVAHIKSEVSNINEHCCMSLMLRCHCRARGQQIRRPFLLCDPHTKRNQGFTAQRVIRGEALIMNYEF